MTAPNAPKAEDVLHEAPVNTLISRKCFRFWRCFFGAPGSGVSCTDTQDAIRPLNEGSRLRFPGVLGWDPRSRVEGDDGPEIRVQLTS